MPRKLPLIVKRLRRAGGGAGRRQLLTEAGDEQRHRCLPASRFTANIAVAGAMQAQDGMAGRFVIAPIKGEGRAVVFELQNIRRSQMQGAPGNGVMADVQAVAVKMQAFRVQHVTRLPQRPPQGDQRQHNSEQRGEGSTEAVRVFPQKLAGRQRQRDADGEREQKGQEAARQGERHGLSPLFSPSSL